MFVANSFGILMNGLPGGGIAMIRTMEPAVWFGPRLSVGRIDSLRDECRPAAMFKRTLIV
jgi:hypothetical protein